MRQADRSTTRAFTLVELLVVIGIIAVLMGILLPVVSKARAQANRTACQSNVRQLYVGILNYCNDNHDWYPTCAEPGGTPFVQYADDWIYWQQPVRAIPAGAIIDDSPIAKYLHVKGDALKALLRCPADTFDDRKPFVGSSTNPVQGPYLYSYGLNYGVGVNFGTSSGQTLRTKRQQWHRQYDRILITEDLNMLPNHYAGPLWEASQLTRRHGQAISRQTHVLMAVNVSAAFMDGHVAIIDDDFAYNNMWQISVQSP